LIEAAAHSLTSLLTKEIFENKGPKTIAETKIGLGKVEK
jgi:hypothetical protein